MRIANLSLMLCCLSSALVAHAQEPAKKPLVAVMDFKAKGVQMVVGKDISGFAFSSEFVDLLNSELVTALVNDRTFDVVERERLKQLEEEKQLASVTNAGLAALGKELSADFLVYGDIELLEMQKRHQQMNGFEQDLFTGTMVVNLRVVEVATSRIKYAQKVTCETRRGSNAYTTFIPMAFAEDLKSETVKRLVTNISEGISPIQVRAVRDGKVYLNRGEQAFAGGERLLIVNPVDTVYDEDGSVLDVIEEEAGVVVIESVRPHMAIATIAEEKMPLEVGFIARRLPPN